MFYKPKSYPIGANVIEIFVFDDFYYFKSKDASELYTAIDESEFNEMKSTIIRMENAEVMNEKYELYNALKILLGGE